MQLSKSLTAILLVLPIFAGDETQPTTQGLTVHEWGTFTSVAGEDGSAVNWDALGCKSDLPGFVNDFGYRGFKKWNLSGTVRMETPVMYFYSPHQMDLQVRVAFPKGLITEWYPGAEYEVYQETPTGSLRRREADLNGFDTSLRSITGAIEWRKITVQPDTSPILPLESGPNRYYAARETDAAPIMVGDQHEKFLFYRGVGRFPVPLSVRVSRDEKIVVGNRSHDPVPFVILFEKRGGHLGYRKAGAVDDIVTLDPPALDASFSQLSYELETALVGQGLYPKEARAMLETWRDSWFEEGSRLIYIVPSHAVDAILPLKVEPAPSETARVFVGRIELITTETKRSVEKAIAKGDWSAISQHERFLGPILKRIYPGNLSKANQIERLYRSNQAKIGAGTCP